VISKDNYLKVLQGHLIETIHILKLLEKERNTTRNKDLLISYRSLEQAANLLAQVVTVEQKRTKANENSKRLLRH